MDSSLHTKELETCGVRLPLRRMDHPQNKTISHALPEDCAHYDALWKEKIDCDMVIEIDGEKISVHKSVLIARSPHFERMWNGNWNETSSETINISIDHCEFDTISFIYLLEYIYTGVITIDKNTPTMMFECAFFMLQSATFEDILPIYFFFRSRSYDGIDRMLFRMIDANFVPISRTYEFGKLSIDDLIGIIPRDTLNVDDEKQIFETVSSWIGDDIGRIEHGMSRHGLINHFPEAATLISEAKIDRLSAFKNYERVCDDARRSIIILEYHERSDNYEVRDEYEEYPERKLRANPVSIFDPVSNQWIRESTERRPHPDMATARVGLTIFFIGINEEGGYRCDTKGGIRWTNVPLLSLRRCRQAIGVMGRKIFAAGGGVTGRSCETTTAYYDTSLKSPEWTRVADMNIRRTEAAGCVHKGFLYVIGGGDYKIYEENEYAHCERYNPQTNTWSMIASMSQARRGCSAIVFNGKIIVAGGHYNDEDKGYITLRKVEAYDPTTDQWERLANLTIQRQKPTLVVSDGKLMAMGGYADYWDQERLSSVEEYDKENNTWKERREMQMADGHPYIFALPTSASIPTELQL